MPKRYIHLCLPWLRHPLYPLIVDKGTAGKFGNFEVDSTSLDIKERNDDSSEESSESEETTTPRVGEPRLLIERLAVFVVWVCCFPPIVP